MIRTRHREKLLNALIYFAQNTTNVSKTKLFKLLHFLDFLHFQQTGRSVTGLTYKAWDRGPVPEELYYEWDRPRPDFNAHLRRQSQRFPNGKERQFVVANRKFDDIFFSPLELKLMEGLAKKHFRHNAEEMSELSHFEAGPWHEIYKVRGQPSEEIPYELALLRRDSDQDRRILELAKEYKELQQNYQ